MQCSSFEEMSGPESIHLCVLLFPLSLSGLKNADQSMRSAKLVESQKTSMGLAFGC